MADGARERGTASALAIGGTVSLAALVAGPLTGASMNPARSLAPALWSGAHDGAWIYVIAPIAGAQGGGAVVSLAARGRVLRRRQLPVGVIGVLSCLPSRAGSLVPYLSNQSRQLCAT